jgi:hypothetical protein
VRQWWLDLRAALGARVHNRYEICEYNRHRDGYDPQWWV